MTPAPPVIEISGLVKQYPAPQPLRIAELAVGARDEMVLAGFDADAAEMFVLLVTGASVPDEGTVRIAGKDTREIATDTEWLHSLDRFGLVTERAVLIEKLPVAANLALPLTLAIDPIPEAILPRVQALAAEVGLAADRLEAPVSGLSSSERLRLHLARALASLPEILILEHATARVTTDTERAAFGATLHAVAAARGIGWVALSNDPAFTRASGGTTWTFDAATGRLRSARGWRAWLGR